MIKRREQTKRIVKVLYVFVIVLLSLVTVYATYRYFTDNRYETYRSEEHGFVMDYPQGWEVRENYQQANVVFLSPKQNDIDIFRENVTVVIQDHRGKDYTLESYSSLAISQMKQIFQHRMEVLDESSTRLAGYPAQRFMFVGTEKENELQFLQVWTLAGGRAYQLTYAGFESSFPDFKPRAEHMFRSFRLE